MSDAEFAELYLTKLRELGDEERFDITFRIESGHTGLPRASKLGSCARAQLHSLLGLSVTDKGNPAYAWSAMMGYAGQEIILEVLRRMGYTVNTDVDLEQDTSSGHLDAEITGLDLGDEVVVVDCKVRNVYAAKQWVREGLDLDTQLQMQRYMRGRGRQRALIVMAPHDYSTWRLETTKYKLDVASAVVQRFWVQGDAAMQQLVDDRASALLTAKALGLKVYREFDPTSKADARFPCGFCETRTHCFQDDLDIAANPESVLLVPQIPIP